MVHRARHVLLEIGPVVRVESVACLLRGGGRVEVAAGTHLQGSGVVAGVGGRLVVQLHQTAEPGGSGQQGNKQGQPQPSGPRETGRGSANADPDGEPVLDRARCDVHSGNALGQRPLPGHGCVVPQLQQQLQLLVEEGVMVLQFVAEQRVGLDECAASGDDLRAPVGDQVQGGELLKEPHGVLRGEHRDGRAEPQRRGFPGDGGQHDFGADSAKSRR